MLDNFKSFLKKNLQISRKNSNFVREYKTTNSETMIQNMSITQTEALVAHYQSSSKTAQRNFVRWILSTDTDENSTAVAKDTEKVFRAISRGIKNAEKYPAMSVDEAEEMLKSL